MNDLDYNQIINGLQNGELKSPQRIGESLYIVLRITGTGITERYKLNDNGEPILKDGKPEVYKINRLESEFLSEDFLNACNGIPVLLDHPHTNDQLIDGENFKEHIVGTIVKAFVKGKEVWGIARILDPNVLSMILSKMKSTSPAVTSRNEIGDNDIVNEHFERIDHVALVSDGYWDDYSDKAIQIDSKKKIKGANMDKEKLISELSSILNELGIPDEIMDKINAKLDALAKTDEPVKTDVDEPPAEPVKTDADVDESKDETPAKKNDTKVDDNGGLETLATKLIELVIAKLGTQTKEPPAEPVKTDADVDESKDDIDDLINAEDEEEKNNLVDEAIKLNQSYADMKCPKAHAHDTKESYLRRVLLLNKSFIDSKYKSLVDRLIKSDLPKAEYGLAVDCFKSIGATLKTQAEAKIKADAKVDLSKQKRVEKTANGTVYHNMI